MTPLERLAAKLADDLAAIPDPAGRLALLLRRLPTLIRPPISSTSTGSAGSPLKE